MSTVETESSVGVGTDVPPSVAVIEAVAAAEGVDARRLNPPLDTVVDGDALDALFADAKPEEGVGGHVRFTYRGHSVVVDSAGDVSVEP